MKECIAEIVYGDLDCHGNCDNCQWCVDTTEGEDE